MISFSAVAPCPWPKDSVCSLSPFLHSSANLNIIAVGSDPGLSKKIIGEAEFESGKISRKIMAGDTVNSRPRLRETYWDMAKTNLSCLRMRSSSMILKSFRLLYGSGGEASWGSVLDVHSCHLARLFVMCCRKPSHSLPSISSAARPCSDVCVDAHVSTCLYAFITHKCLQ
jgi:hypothetical protein